MFKFCYFWPIFSSWKLETIPNFFCTFGFADYIAVVIITGFSSTAKAQYSNYHSTRHYNNGYGSYHSDNRSRCNTSVSTHRNYNYGGGYNSSTNVYRNGSLSTTSSTYRSPYGGSTTIKYNHNTGRTTYRYSSR